MRSISKRKPSWPFRINWDCPQAEGLECLISFINTRGVILTKRGGLGLGVPTSTNRFRFDKKGETGIDFNTSDVNAITFPYPDAPFITSAGSSIIWAGIIDASTGGNQQLVGKYVLPGTTTTPFSIYYSNATSRLAIIRAGATNFVEYSGPVISSLFGSYNVFGISVNTQLTTGGSTLYLSYINGIKTAMGLSFGSTSEAVTGTNADIHIGHIASIAQLDGYCSHILFYNKCISDVAMAAAADPVTQWDIYWQENRWTLFDVAVAATSPFNQVHWPNPGLLKYQNTGYIHTTTSLIPPPQTILNAQKDWPNPLRKGRPNVGHIDYDTFIDENVKPIGKDLFPINTNRRGRGVDWTQNRPQFYNDNKPFKQDAWPNPALEFKPTITHIHNRKPDEPPTPEPFKIPLFPNPLKKERVRPGHTDNFSLEETFTHPVGSSVQDLPVLNVKPSAKTWINPRPIYYTEPEVIVFRQNEWPNPQRKRRLNGVVNTHFLDTGTTQVPFNQNNWPLPLRKRIHPHWEDNYVLDDNVPFIYQVSFVPLSKSKFVPTWIRSLVLSDTNALPNIPYSYPNPIILKQHTQSWIENLLQRTLDPGEGEKPFNQNDYPNPLIGIKLLHVGWIDGRKHYFSEPPLQIAQYDWPVFRAPRINPVGFIHSQKQNEEPPKFVSVLEIPVLKKVLGISWIDTALINLSAPPTIQPFSQKDWPNPRFKIPYYNNFNIFRPTSLVPPNIVGRRICIDAGITIFELEAAIEEFDLNARMEEFNLEAGGEDCE